MLNWNTNLKTGIDKFDNQHKETFKRLNKLLFAMRNSSGISESLVYLDFLEKYVAQHFSDEEVLQKKFNFPNFNDHIAEHEQFKNALKELRLTIKTNGISSASAIQSEQRLITWWESHIVNMDLELGAFLHDMYK